ncbi:MAG: hypothetical protein ACOC6H_04830, partial [Thermoproteota archaeon]
MAVKEYVSRMEEACGEGRDFIILLRPDKREQAIQRILDKCEEERSLSGVMTKVKYNDIKLSVFVTGKIIMKDLTGKEEAE